jgi:hypothetical protein
MGDPIRPDPDAEVRTSCSRPLIVELADLLGVNDSNPDVVLLKAINAAYRLKGLEK